MDELQRINVKLYLRDADSLSSEEAFRIFNAWIAASSDEVLVDVADYSHVGHGPETILIGHEANYSLDSDGGEAGLLYARKQDQSGTVQERLRGALAAALRACRRLETEPELADKVSFRGGDLKVTANDRLLAPNTPEGERDLRAALEPVLDALFAGAQYDVERDDSSRERLSLRVRAKGEFSAEILLANLAA